MNDDYKPTTLQEAIEKIARGMEVRPERALVGDDAVKEEIQRLSEYGYRPSVQIVEPVRAVLSGYGVLLSGQTGVGKTMLMRLMNVGRIYTSQSISEWGIARINDWHEWTHRHQIVIDDLGIEHTTVEYGNRDDVMKQVIAYRAEQTKMRTCITTNLTAAQISERYGDRTLSRILGMCRPYTMTGVSMRKPEAV